MAGHIEGRLAYLKAKLSITEAQEPLWKSYAPPRATMKTPCLRV